MQKNKQTIGFYGDSFCARRTSGFKGLKKDDQKNNNISWVKQLEQEYKLIHVGQGGSNIWDCILYQWGEHQYDFEVHHYESGDKDKADKFRQHFYKTLNPGGNIFNQYGAEAGTKPAGVYPDIAVFCWTNPSRLFTTERLGICIGDVENNVHQFRSQKIKNRRIFSAAKQYYKHLFSWKQNIVEYNSALHFFDTHFLNQVSEKTKIIHFYVSEGPFSGELKPGQKRHGHYIFKNGMTLYPELDKIQKHGNSNLIFSWGPGNPDPSECHMNTIEKNNFLCSMVRQSLESYSNGETRDFEIPNFN